LLLPPWFEHERAKIVAMLEPIVVPEANRPKGARKSAAAKPATPPPAAAAKEPSVPVSRRTDATFIGGDR